jgi:hypothetical protein
MKTYRVEFFDHGGAYLGERHVPFGAAATPPMPQRSPKGWRFDHWEPQVCYVMGNTRTVAVYAPKEYPVTFVSETGQVLKREYVPHGRDATPPHYVSPSKGCAAAWNGRTQNIQRAEVFQAVFEVQLA